MITIKEIQNKFYLQINSVSTPVFNSIILYLRNKGLKYEAGKGSTNSNPHYLLELLDELADNYDTFIQDSLRKKIEDYNPYTTIKPQRFAIDESLFEKFPPKFPEQREDAIRMARYGRFANWSKQGTGKTYTTIQALNILFSANKIDRVLIVVIPWLVYNWKREILQFSSFFTEDDILIVTEENRDVFVNPELLPKIVITSYSTIRLCSDHIWKLNNPYKEVNIDKLTADLKKYCKDKKIDNPRDHKEELEKVNKKFYRESLNNYRKEQIDFSSWGINRVFIQDEAHRSKNMTTRWTQIIHKEKKYFDYRYPLTGTPHPNGIWELYSNVKFMDDELVDENYTDFLRTLGTVGNQWSDYALDSVDEEKANKFLERIKPYFVRRELREVMKDLPETYQKRVYIELKGKQKELYQRLVEEQLTSIKNEKGNITYRDVQVKFPYLMSSLSDPCLLEGKLTTDFLKAWKFEDSLKVQTCQQIIESLFEENPDQKIVIWEDHPHSINRLAKLFKKYNPIVVHGEVKSVGEKYKWRDDQVQLFKNDKDRKLLIANPTTLGTGQNLQFVSNVIYFSRNADFVNWDQSLSREERIGMIGEVTYWILLIDKSLDIHIDTVLNNKEVLDRLYLKQGLTTKDCKDIFTGIKI